MEPTSLLAQYDSVSEPLICVDTAAAQYQLLGSLFKLPVCHETSCIYRMWVMTTGKQWRKWPGS